MQALRSSFGAMFRSGARAAVATSPVNSIATLRPGLGVASLQHVFGWGPIAAGQVRTMRHGQMRGKLSRSPKRRCVSFWRPFPALGPSTAYLVRSP